MKLIIGIDPGKTGAITIIKGDEIETLVMPIIDTEIDTRAISDLFLEIRSEIQMVFLEDIFSLPKCSGSSMLSFGRSHGKIEGVLVALRIPYQLIRAASWQKVMFAGVTGTDTKNKALKVASKLFPQVELKATSRSKVAHSGIVDGLLIAEYGRRMLRGHA